MPKQRNNISSTTNNQGTKAVQKVYEKFQESKLKDMGDCDFNDSEFKKAVLKKIQWDTRKLRKSVSSGIKSINKKRTLPKRLKL